jgi:hypothetical protein
MEGEADEDIVQRINSDQRRHVRHEGVHVPQHGNPFSDSEEEDKFFQVLAGVVEQGIEPEGYGLYADEWEDGSYPIWESIKLGKRAGKEIHVSLQEPLWKCRAVLWVQGINVLAHFHDNILFA